MSRVPAKITEITEKHAWCDKCGCGNVKDLTEMSCPTKNCDGFRRVEFFTHTYRAHLCSC